MVINTPNINEARKKIKLSKKPIIVQAQNDNFNRRILEQNKNIILLFPDKTQRKDKLKQLDSGLNHVLAVIATKNNNKIGINLEYIQTLEKKQKAIQLARLKQNIKICKKAKTPIIFYPKPTSLQQVQSLLITLGASSQQAKQAIEN